MTTTHQATPSRSRRPHRGRVFLAALALSLTAAALPRSSAAQSRLHADEIVLPETEPHSMLRLRDGRVLWGRVLSHWADGVRFERLDTGGRVALGWGLLDPGQEQELRQRFGYLDVRADELMVEAERILLAGGHELVGVIIDRNSEYLFVKSANRVIQVPAPRVIGSGGRTLVPALDVYTREELYNAKLEELSGALAEGGSVAAAAHRDLAEHAERIFDFLHAVEHYRAAQEADPSFEADEIGLALRMAEPKAERQEEVDALAHTDLLRARGHYDEALEELTAFANTYPGSPLLINRAKLVKRVERAQDRALREQVVFGILRHAEDLTREVARKLGYEESLSYLESQLQQDIVAATVEDLQSIKADVDAGTVMTLWNERKGGRWHKARYGIGTWLLGEDARAGLDEKEQGEDGTERSAEREEFKTRIDRYMKNQKLAMSAGRQEDDGENPSEFWKTLTSPARASWLLAWYAENSGQFQVSRIRFQNCRYCGGKGVREVLNAAASLLGKGTLRTLEKCKACHGIGVTRGVSFR